MGDGWGALTGTSNPYGFTAADNSLSITLTETMIDELINKGGLVLTGHGIILQKVTIQ